jgi:hypothetical protein
LGIETFVTSNHYPFDLLSVPLISVCEANAYLYIIICRDLCIASAWHP